MVRVWAGLVFAVMLAATPAFAADGADCQLKAFSRLEMTFGPDGRVSIPVSINGQSVRLLVDTGASISMVDFPTAKLPGMRIFGSPRVAVEVYGGFKSHSFVFVQNSAFGDMSPGYHPFFVAPRGAFADSSGLLGADVLKNFDVEFDFANNQLAFFSQAHCPDRVVYWTHDPYTRVGFEMDREDHIRVPVQLNGGTTLSTIDTGATETVGSFEDLTEGLHIDAKDPALKPIMDAKGNVRGYHYPFATLTFEGVTINNPDIVLVPNALSKFPADQRQLIIGMNILRRLHLYVAYGEHALYITPATAH